MTDKKRAPVRTTYRHGDLHRALLEAGIELAKELGPEAVTLREATRRAGVVPNAAYRHFASHGVFMESVRSAALAAMARAMERRLRALGPERDDLDFARATLRAVGAAYLQFARKETGLFRTAFVVKFNPPPNPDARMAGRSGLNPFQLLSAALDRVARAGGLPTSHRPGAEYLAWSAVHGMAMLSIDGPLRRIGATQYEALGSRLLDMVEKGV
ncbi:MAG: hypothetical protein QOD56_2168 [Gammaproteobacteria bacterium]|jgi:AcrR family transcriptional regulator|nr:hypothetical protein [Gammaproteobacteria bacterium]